MVGSSHQSLWRFLDRRSDGPCSSPEEQVGSHRCCRLLWGTAGASSIGSSEMLQHLWPHEHLPLGVVGTAAYLLLQSVRRADALGWALQSLHKAERSVPYARNRRGFPGAGIIYSPPRDHGQDFTALEFSPASSHANCHPFGDRQSCMALTLAGACVGIFSLRSLCGGGPGTCLR